MKQLAVIAALLLITTFLFSQVEPASKKSSLGFSLGINLPTITAGSGTIPGSSISNEAGIRMGLLYERLLSEQLRVSPKVGMSINNSVFKNAEGNPEVLSIPIDKVNIDFAVHLSYHLNRVETGPYLLVGVSVRSPLDDEDDIQITSDFHSAFDFGFGFEKQFSSFSMTPEFRYSLGMGDHDTDLLANMLNYQNLAIVLLFKG